MSALSESTSTTRPAGDGGLAGVGPAAGDRSREQSAVAPAGGAERRARASGTSPRATGENVLGGVDHTGRVTQPHASHAQSEAGFRDRTGGDRERGRGTRALSANRGDPGGFPRPVENQRRDTRRDREAEGATLARYGSACWGWRDHDPPSDTNDGREWLFKRQADFEFVKAEPWTSKLPFTLGESSAWTFILWSTTSHPQAHRVAGVARPTPPLRHPHHADVLVLNQLSGVLVRADQPTGHPTRQLHQR